MDNRGPRCARGMGGVGEEPLSPSMAVPSEEAEHHTSPLSPRRWQTSCHCLQLWKAARPTVQELGGALVMWKLRATPLPPMNWASDLGPRVGEAQELPDGFSLLGEDEEDEEDEEGKLTPVRPGGLVAVF